MSGFRGLSLFAFAGLLIVLRAQAAAQGVESGTIAGVVKDTTGAVLPGVTVEAASPAIIEKVRTAVTDHQGQYKILNLRPGTYTVTFTLTGFGTFRREGLELTTGFTATANADLKVGSLEETVTVTGSSPVVDTQNVRSQSVLSNQILDALPAGTKSTSAFAQLTLGARGAVQDVGGNTGEAPTSFGVHGSTGADGRHILDGMIMTDPHLGSSMGNRLNYVNELAIQEVTVTVRGASAEQEAGGVHLNYVPKDGGNTFRISAIATGANNSMQSKFVPSELRARGVTNPPSIKRVHDVGVSLGGPIRQDKLWFFTTWRDWGAQNYAPGMYFADKTSPAARGGLVFVPDLNRPAYSDGPNWDVSGRATWQVSPKNKLTISESVQHACICYQGVGATRAPEATVQFHNRTPLTQATWTYPRTNRVLFEAGFTHVPTNQRAERAPGLSTTAIPVTDLGTGLNYNARGDSVGLLVSGGDTLAYVDPVVNHQGNGRFSMSYVTGSHAFKTGFQLMEAFQGASFKMNDPPVRYSFRTGVPVQIQQWIDPVSFHVRAHILGIYAQDQWTMNRLTLNLGARFDYLNGFTESEDVPAGMFVPARSFPKVAGLPVFKDISPRLGAAYDLFGNSKTAVKVSIGKYVAALSTALAVNNHPEYQIATNATRSWTDGNGDLVPDCVLTNPLANGECGQISNLNLGRTISTQTYADDVKLGWGNRPYSWQGTVSVQHELHPGVALTGGYYRTWYGNFSVTDNLAVTPANFDPFCIAAPSDARLPDAGGYQVCGLHDVNPSRFGLMESFVTQASHYGERTEVYNGFDVGINARLGGGAFVQGGVATGQTVTNSCFAIDSPQVLRFCEVTVPYKGQTQYKASAIYPLPWWGIRTSGVFQNMPGPAINANFNFGNVQAAPSLGRNLTTGAGSTPLYEPNTRFEGRMTEVDFRVSKLVSVGRGRLDLNLDIYTLFDARAVLGVNSTYGAAWMNATSVLGGRLFKVGGQVNF
jgi:hypothetical protein